MALAWRKITRRLTAVYFLLISFFFGHSANGQYTGPSFINFNNKDGLSSNSVNAIIKDKYGYMWFATEDGLNKFDGANFTVYRHNVIDSTTIGGNVITALYEDHSGNLWVGTNQSLSLYNREKDAFVNYHIGGNGAVRTVIEDHSGNLWLGGYWGLYRFNRGTGKVKRYSTTDPNTGRLLSNTILCVYEDRLHRLWIGTSAGLNRYLPDSDRFAGYRHSNGIQNTIADNIVRAIVEDPTGNIWFGTNNGLSKLPAGREDFVNYSFQNKDVGSINANRIYAVKADKSGQLWVGTEEGLDILDPASGKWECIRNDQRNKYSLVGRSVRSIFIDGTGLYWVCTWQGGINKYDKNLAFFNLRESNPLDPHGLSSSVVTSFAEGRPGDIYVGTDGGGLNLYHTKTGLFDHPRLTANNGNNKLSILAMERTGDELWIGTYQQGLYVLNTGTGGVKHFSEGDGPNDLRSNEIFCVKQDSNGNIWVGTNGKGVSVYDRKTGQFYCPGKAVSGRSGQVMINGFIRAIEKDRLGNIWIGSNGAGIVVYNPSSHATRILDQNNSSLPSNIVLSLHLDHEGNMWVGSMGGLSLFAGNSERCTSFSEPDGLSNGVIYKILEDDFGKIWVSTNSGISSFDRKHLRFKNFSYQNGLERSSFSLGAGLKTARGEMFFGGLNGFNYFDPLGLQCNKNTPLLQLTALKIFNKTVVPGDDDALKMHVSIAKEIRLDYKQNFSIDFISLNYTAPQESRYSYKLEGFDKDWNHIGNSHTAVYTNVDPGEYTFRVKASSDDGSWSTPEKTIRIYVKPPFWRTKVAYLLYILTAVLIVGLMRYMGIRKLKNKFALEQERQQVRQMIAEERKEAERQHEFDQLKIKFLTNLSHELRTPVSLITGPVDKLLGQEKITEKRAQLSTVKRNANRILNLVNQLLDLRKLEETELNLHLTTGDIISFVRDIAGSFNDISDAKQINFNFTASINHYYTRFDSDKLERVLLNLLSNAFKFTGKDGKIELLVELVAESGVIKIIVSDTGIGMSKEVQGKIFSRFYQGNENRNVPGQGSGIGLSIAKEFVKLHGGSIDVESIPDKGSIFTVLLPCAPIPESEAVAGLPDPEEEGLPAKRPKQKSAVYQNFTILLIEDNDDFRHYLRDNLKPYYKIVEASNGKEGWQKVLSSHPHVVVSDINMPFIDGITLSRKIKSDKRTSHIPIILLTAITGDSNQLKGLQTGACDYLMKPFNFEILNIKIRNLVALNQNFKETYSKQLKVIPSVPSEAEVQSEDAAFLAKITQYIESHIDSPNLTVEELSRHVFMSRGSLYTRIIDLTGETPVEFIRSIKLSKGAFLLERSDMRIAQIGYAVGFSSPNYFAKAFKAKFNLSPSEYAQQKRGIVTTQPGE